MPAHRYALDIDRVNFTAQAHATWIEDDSNVVDRSGQAIFSYDRWICGLRFAFTFD